MKRLKKELAQCRYTLFHPVNGFYSIKWDDTGSVRVSLLIMLLFFLVNVFDAVLTGFMYNMKNPDKISVPSIFMVAIGAILLWFISNWSVSSLMFTEGKLKHIFVLTCYSILPYCIMELIYIFLTNLLPRDMSPFLSMLRLIGIGWSAVLLFFGTYEVHQVTVSGVVANLLLTIFGVLIMLFLMLLGYSLLQQMYIFIYTLFSEVVFRM